MMSAMARFEGTRLILAFTGKAVICVDADSGQLDLRHDNYLFCHDVRRPE